MKTLLFESDWLASKPVFYHTRTGLASHDIHDVVDYSVAEFDPEGVNNFLDFGYSVFEQTPIKDVKFLRHSARLWRDERGALSVDYLDDPVDRWLDYRLSESDVVDLIRDRVRRWERSVEGEIVIPTSGGYDSRLLNWCVEDKSRIRSYTYGVSRNQAESYEVVYARRLSAIMGTSWEQIQLGDFHRYFDEWDRLFGVSTHAHGMYHIEFYNKVLKSATAGSAFLSGMIGDAWAGAVSIPELSNQDDVYRLAYSHGVHADSSQSVIRNSDKACLAHYWETEKIRLEDPRRRIIAAMRFKVILLCYLRRVPEVLGFRWWSPFLDIDIAMAMLNLPPERRRQRAWQQDLFKKVGLDLESMRLTSSNENTLDLDGLRRIPLRPLRANVLADVVRPSYVEWINRSVAHFRGADLLNPLSSIPLVGGGLRRLGLLTSPEVRAKAYNAHLILRPLENVVLRRTA